MFRPVASLAIALLGLGCIPTAPTTPQAAPIQPSGEAFSLKKPVVAPGNVGLSFGGPENANAAAQIIKLADGSGYRIQGSFGLTGTLKPAQEPNLWKLDAKFNFPTGGFSVGTPYLTAMGNSLQDPQKDLLDYQGLIMINIPLQLPQKDAMTTQAIQEVPVTLDIHAGPNANFTIVLASA